MVSISIVPDTTSKINLSLDRQRIDNRDIQFIINPHDEFTLNKAIHLKEINQAKVTIVCVGNSSVEPLIRRGLAIGADDAIRVDCEPLDSLLVAKEISQIYKEGKYDILLFGKESIDYNGGVVASMVAAILNLPFINNCIGLTFNHDQLKLIRDNEQGKEFLIVNYPIVIAGQKGLVADSELRIPNIRGIIQSRNKLLKVKSSQFKSDHKIKIIKFEFPPSRKKIKLIDPNNLKELLILLKEQEKISF